jgi:hypothetical protein
MNTAIDRAFAFRIAARTPSIGTVGLQGTRPLMAGAAIEMPWDPDPTRPSDLGSAGGLMGYHGIIWASMGFGRNTLENLGFFGFLHNAVQMRVNGINCLQSVLKVELDQCLESLWFKGLGCSW